MVYADMKTKKKHIIVESINSSLRFESKSTNLQVRTDCKMFLTIVIHLQIISNNKKIILICKI